jgi:hypothetical protein
MRVVSRDQTVAFLQCQIYGFDGPVLTLLWLKSYSLLLTMGQAHTGVIRTRPPHSTAALPSVTK